MQDKTQETKNFETLSLLKDLIFKSKYIIFFSFFVYINQAYAQKLEIGTGVGVVQYKGDLYTSYRPFSGNAGANLFVRYNLSRAVSIKVSGMIGKASAKDSKIDNPLNQIRNFSFTTDIQEAAIYCEYNFLNFRTNASRIRSNWTPYVFGGYGMYSTQKTTLTHQFYGGSPSQQITEHTEYALPFGIGFKKQWRNKWNWGIEFGARKLFTDEFDGFGYKKDIDGNETSTFAISAASSPNPIDKQIYSPTTKLKDMYYYTNIYVSYVFYKVHCPPRR